jgi:hypothetical protein
MNEMSTTAARCNLGRPAPFWYNTSVFLSGLHMTTDRRRIDLVLRVFKELVAAGADGVLPGAVNSRLREIGEPMGTWTVRGAFSALESEGEIVIDEQTSEWHLTDDRAKARPRSGTA